jgi:BirA family biotin operon repressor/biotin-[acetyl-CoA-carboxylase] ligase
VDFPPREEWHLKTGRIGRRVLVFDRVPSTNNLAASFAHDRDNDGLALLALEQTAGRGQHGRTWTCQPGMGVLLSVLLFPDVALRRPVILAAWAANSVCETIRQVAGLDSDIKWPNDVLVSGRKVCGILIEQGRGTVVGIGLNVNQPAASLAEAALPNAASLACFTGVQADVLEVARTLLEQMDRQYQSLMLGRLIDLEASWQQRTRLLGEPVMVETTGGNYLGQLTKLTFEEIAIADSAGHQRFQPEMVRHITHA